MKLIKMPILNNVHTRFRVNAASAGGACEITLPTTNVLGALWFYLGSSALAGEVVMDVVDTGFMLIVR